jgi:pimeloyl-ACP methyl ester carboxylesterase
MRADGWAERDVVTAVAFAKARMDLIRGIKPFEELDKAQQRVKNSPWFEYVHLCDEALFYSARRNIEQDTEPWWENVHCPVLVIFGDKDTSSGPPEPSVTIIRRGLAKAGNKNVAVTIFANADHSLCQTRTGGRKEARERAQAKNIATGPNFVDRYLTTMSVWLEKQAAK